MENNESQQENDASGFTSYKNYVNFLAGCHYDSCHRWLASFFNQQSATIESTQIHVLDSEGGRIVRKHPPIEFLNVIPEGIKTRIIVLEYEETWAINRYKLDCVAFALNLPPYSLWQHLNPTFPKPDFESTAPSIQSFATHDLRADLDSDEYCSFEYGYWPFEHLSCWIQRYKKSSSATVGKNQAHR